MSDEGADAFDMGLLSQRMDEVRDADAARQATRMVKRASNWRDGRCAQRTVLVIDDWVRRLRVAGGMLAVGTHGGEVVLAELSTGETIQRWGLGAAGARPDDDTESTERAEVTAIYFDGERVGSGDAAGNVLLRSRTRGTVLRGKHAHVVTGVHWPGDERAYSSGADRRLVAWDLGGSPLDPGEAAAGDAVSSATWALDARGGGGDAVVADLLQTARPIMCLSVVGGCAPLSPAPTSSIRQPSTFHIWQVRRARARRRLGRDGDPRAAPRALSLRRVRRPRRLRDTPPLAVAARHRRYDVPAIHGRRLPN